jgi:hypothetical protein
LRQAARRAWLAEGSQHDNTVAMFDIDDITIAEAQELPNLGGDHHPPEAVKPAFDT